MNLIEKIILIFKKPSVVVLTDNNRELIKRIAVKIMGSSFKVEREIFFAGNVEKIDLSSRKYLISNFDKGSIRKFKEGILIKTLTFGFQEGADFQVTDVKINGGTNFKINYQGKIVPIWLMGTLTREEIYSVLAAVAIGTALGLNLVEISQSLK